MQLAERLDTVRAEIVQAARDAGRDPGEVTTIVVTKFHPASLVRELAGLGVRDVGESRHQEALAKSAELADLDLRWHFVGQLQSNKARQVRQYASVMHSVDRAALVAALAARARARRLPPGEPHRRPRSRRSAARGSRRRLAELVLSTPGLRLRGLMAVAPLDAEPRAAFARVRGLFRAAPSRSHRRHPRCRWGCPGTSRRRSSKARHTCALARAITGNRPARG